MPEVPHIPKPLLDYLKSIFPDRCPEVNTSDRQVWVDAGSVKVVRHLDMLFQEQQENALRSKT